MMDNSQTVPKLTLQRRIESMDLVFMAAGRQSASRRIRAARGHAFYHMLHFVLKGKVHFYLGGSITSSMLGNVSTCRGDHCSIIPIPPIHAYAWVNFTGDDAVEIVRECGMSNVPHDRLARM